MYESRSIPFYLKSQFTSTKEKMAAMTPEQLALADKVYTWAEKNYEKGGDVIVECLEPWEVVKQFKSVKSARGFARLRHDHAEDIRNA